jgi:hypothetical protein
LVSSLNRYSPTGPARSSERVRSRADAVDDARIALLAAFGSDE